MLKNRFSTIQRYLSFFKYVNIEAFYRIWVMDIIVHLSHVENRTIHVYHRNISLASIHIYLATYLSS